MNGSILALASAAAELSELAPRRAGERRWRQKKEKLDFLTKLRIRELILMGLITITAVLANLPQEYVEDTLGVSRATLLAVLGIAVIIGLFLYLKFLFFIAVVLLIAGANMPEQIAEGLNISKIPIMLALVALVGVGLINYVVKLMPTGLEPKPQGEEPGGRQARCSTPSRRTTWCTRRRCCR